MQESFAAGDRVKFIDEAGEAIIRRILNNESAEIEVDGIEIAVPIKRLIKINPEDIHAYERTCINIVRQAFVPQFAGLRPAKAGSGPSSCEGRKTKEQGCKRSSGDGAIPEIDLHIEKLVDDFSDLTNFEIVKLQLSHFHRFLEDAIEKKTGKIIVIHGVGEGKLKKEIHGILSNYDFIRHCDAPYELYGGGATMITLIHGNTLTLHSRNQT